jgi:hypothetical protein
VVQGEEKSLSITQKGIRAGAKCKNRMKKKIQAMLSEEKRGRT